MKRYILFSLVWSRFKRIRYAIEIILLPSEYFLLSDASRPKSDGSSDLSCGYITPLEGFPSAVSVTFDWIKKEQSGDKEYFDLPKAMKLDDGTSLMCHVSVIREVLRCLADEIKGELGMRKQNSKSFQHIV